MTLRELAERYDRNYEFRLFNEGDDSKTIGKYERNELVKLNYPVAERAVASYKESEIYFNLVYVYLKEDK